MKPHKNNLQDLISELLRRFPEPDRSRDSLLQDEPVDLPPLVPVLRHTDGGCVVRWVVEVEDDDLRLDTVAESMLTTVDLNQIKNALAEVLKSTPPAAEEKLLTPICQHFNVPRRILSRWQKERRVSYFKGGKKVVKGQLKVPKSGKGLFDPIVFLAEIKQYMIKAV